MTRGRTEKKAVVEPSNRPFHYRVTYDPAHLEQAVRDVLSHTKSHRVAAQYWRVPKATLEAYLQQARRAGAKAETYKLKMKNIGKPPLMSAELEKNLSEFLFEQEKCGRGLSREEVLIEAQLMADQHGIRFGTHDGMPSESVQALYLIFSLTS